MKVNAYKITTCSRGFVLQSDWFRQIQAPEVDSFSHECYQALSSPVFFRREPGNEARSMGRGEPGNEAKAYQVGDGSP